MENIRVENLKVCYKINKGSITAINNVSFEVETGKIICIVGKSGCGKTTLIKSLIGLIRPENGTIKMKDTYLRNMSYIPQECPLIPWRTVLQNACMGAELRGEFYKNSNASQVIKRISTMLSNYGLHGYEHRSIAELSGGMKQRVAVVMAIQSNPKLLLCDEPFSAIDYIGRLDLTKKFKNDCLRKNITTFFVTHNIDEALFLGHYIFVMFQKRIKKVYTPKWKKLHQDTYSCREDTQYNIMFTNIMKDLTDESNE